MLMERVEVVEAGAILPLPLSVPRSLVAEIGTRPTAFAAFTDGFGGYPVCTAITEDRGEDGWALRWILTDRRMRRRGHARRVLEQVIETAGQRGAPGVTAVWTEGLECQEGLARLLVGVGFSEPCPRQWRIAAQAGPTLDHTARLEGAVERMKRRGLVLADFQGITASEEEAVRADLATGAVPAELSPWSGAEPPDPRVSVAIRDGARLIGWLTGAPSPLPGRIVYAAGYVPEPYERRAWLVAAELEVARRQMSHFGPDSWWILSTGIGSLNGRMLRRALGEMPSGTLSMVRRFTAKRLLTSA